MRWLKRDIWKAGIESAGLLIFLVLMVWVPASSVGAYQGVSGLATPVTGTVQATPTVNVTATMTALQEDKLRQEIQQLKDQNEPDLISWLRTNASILLLVGGGLFGFWRWRIDRRDAREKESKDRQEAQDKDLKDREDERRKEIAAQDKELRDRAEERFQTAVTALGDEKEGTQVGGAILLRSFLHEDDEKIYGRYYTQIFDLAVANLRLRHFDTDTPEPLTSLSQALVDVFKESLRLARKRPKRSSRFLDASRIQLDNAYLAEEDLRQIWLPEASLRKAALHKINFSEAVLYGANFSDADLSSAHLIHANLRGANLSSTDLSEADLTGADLSKAMLENANFRKANLKETNFCFADLSGTRLNGVNLSGSDFRGADLRGAHLSEADLREADLRGYYVGKDYPGGFIPILFERTDLSEADLTGAKFDQTSLSHLKDTNLCGVKGLTKEQLEACKAKGAIIDEDTTASPPQSPVSPPASSQSNDAQALSTAPDQANTPPPSTDGGSDTSSQPSVEP